MNSLHCTETAVFLMFNRVLNNMPTKAGMLRFDFFCIFAPDYLTKANFIAFYFANYYLIWPLAFKL